MNNANVEGKVYAITNNVNGMQYVGITTKELKKRIQVHFNSKRNGTPLIKRAILDFGKHSFSYAQIDSADSLEELSKKEIFWIEKLKTLSPNGYNYLPGGFTNEGAIKAREIQIICENTKTIYKSIVKASKATGIPEYLIGFCVSGRQDKAQGLIFNYVDKTRLAKAENLRLKRSQKRSESKIKIRHIASNTVYMGYPAIEKTFKINKNSIRLNCQGYLNRAGSYVFEFVDSNLKKQSDLIRRQRLDKKQKAAQKFPQIRIIETGEVFYGYKSAADAVGARRFAVRQVCVGINDTANGYTFEYVDKEKKNLSLKNRERRKEINKSLSLIRAEKTRKTFSQQVKCLENDIIFCSQIEAARYCKIDKNSVKRSLISGKKGRAGFTFIKINKENVNV